ncbi:MAG: glycosyltransferase family 2 protein [Lachnospiraceae bacterium]|nr:glycosyltransferase family 2 protein [Lachnospiraceae bacterium]
MEKLYIVMPAYNEAENIRSVVPDWHEMAVMAGPDSRLVVVDDGSKDNTYELLCELSKEYPQLIALTKPNSGHGPTCLYAYDYALKNGADYVFQTDSDGQTLTEYFPDFWEARADYEMVIGLREVRNDGFFRLVITRTLRTVLFLFFGEFIRDANLAYRLMKACPLEKALKIIPKDFFLANVLISVYFAKNKLKVKSIPVTIRERQGGTNSIFAPQIIKVGFKATFDLLKIRKRL